MAGNDVSCDQVEDALRARAEAVGPRSGRGNKKERVVSDPLLIVAVSLNQSFQSV
jgi:hypothetical protein